VSLVNAETGEVVATCTPEEARDLTSQIAAAADSLWMLLAEAHDRGAWRALGYGSFREYVSAEFGMTKQRAYQLLDQARVIAAITEASGSTVVDLSERAARDVKPRLKAVTDAIKEKVTAEAAAPEPERVKEIVSEVVAEERAKARQAAEDAQAMRDLRKSATEAGMDQDADRVRQRGEFSRLCRDLASLPPAADLIARHTGFLTDRHVAQAERAYAWLDEFLLEIREAK
jgi:hypothetical protein